MNFGFLSNRCISNLFQSGGSAPGSVSKSENKKVRNASPVVFTVQRLRIQQGQLDFTDRSLNPQFKTKLFALNGVINGLSNKKDTHSQIALDGRVNEFGLARIRGDMDLFNLGNNTQINAQLKNLDCCHRFQPAPRLPGAQKECSGATVARAKQLDSPPHTPTPTTLSRTALLSCVLHSKALRVVEPGCPSALSQASD